MPLKHDTVRALQREIRSMQSGGAVSAGSSMQTGLGTLERAFPDRSFPTAAIHEFISTDGGTSSATSGFMCGLLRGFLAKASGPCLWISKRRLIYPPALKAFGLAPERIVFVHLAHDRDVLWAMEEALKCEGLAAVIGDASELSFTQSRRLQLAVESSRVTGFIHRHRPRREAEANACVTRWRIAPLPGATDGGLPGVAHPRWRIHLQKVRNGTPGVWHFEWREEGFRHLPVLTAQPKKALEEIRKAV